jgi:hypothetical protein
MLAHNPNVILFEETMSQGKKIVLELGKFWGVWDFSYVDHSRGRFGELVFGWRKRSLIFSNSWTFSSGIGIALYSTDLGKEFNIPNIYGMYSDRVSFRTRYSIGTSSIMV